jgi:hypothetical protein
MWLGQGGKECIETLVGKPLRRYLLGRPRKRWEDNIKLDLMEVECEAQVRMEVAQDCVQWQALVLAVLNLHVLLPQC